MWSTIRSELAAWLEAEALALPVFLGKDYVAHHDVARRVVIVPTTDQWGPIESPGGNPRPLATRAAGADVLIHGPDFATTEALVHQVYRGIREACRTSFEIVGGAWSNEIVTVEHGTLYTLQIRVAFAVTDAAFAVAPSDLEKLHTGTLEITEGSPTQGCVSEES